MKKFLSLFLASVMLLSVFTGITTFAATSVATNDGGTIWYKWDFESGIKDTINNQATSALAPAMVVDSDAGNVAKIQWFDGAAANISVFPSSGVKDSTDRFAIVEFDFKKGATTGSCYFRWRDTVANSNRGLYLWDKTSTNGWMHLVLVSDSVANASNKYNISVYSVENGVYTKLSNPTYPTLETNIFGEFRIEVGKGADDIIYIDNLELKTYKEFYEAINGAVSVADVQAIINRYSNLGIYEVPEGLDYLTPAQKQNVMQSLVNQNFSSNEAVSEAISAATADIVVVKEYFNWNFEDGTTLDSVNGTPFLESFDSANVETAVTVDPVNSENKVAVYDFETGHDILTFTDIIDNAYAKNEFKYLTVDFKVYGESDKRIPVYQDFRKRNGTSSVAYYTAKNQYQNNVWHTFKSVINIPEKLISVYRLVDGEWTLDRQDTLIADYGFYRFGFNRAGGTHTLYVDDFMISGYNDVVTEVNESTSAGVLNVLEIYNELGVVKLPASYTSLDAEAKAAFAQEIKSKTYTDVQELRNDIIISLSDDELVVLETTDNADAKLDTVKISVKKDGISLASSQIIIATYVDGALEGLKICPIEGAISNGSIITATEINLDIASATSAKIMLLDNFTSITPATKATKLK